MTEWKERGFVQDSDDDDDLNSISQLTTAKDLSQIDVCERKREHTDSQQKRHFE